jgi:hypothetical protein
MKNNVLLRRSLQSLSHPVTIIVALILFVNARVLQPRYPSWWTGKISDAAWLILAPFLLIALVSWFFPRIQKAQEHRIALLMTAAVTLAFVLLKVSTSINQTVQLWLASILGFPFKLRIDPSDLFVLPASLIALWIWDHPLIYKSGRKVIQSGALLLATAALLADAPAPVDHGITCLIPSGNTAIAIHEMIARGYGGSKPIQTAYISQDGGKTWQYAGNISSDATPTPSSQEPAAISVTADMVSQNCSTQPDTWTLSDPSETALQYLFLSGKGIYASNDGGSSFKKEYDFKANQKVYSAIFIPDRQLILALGENGILIQNPDFGWKPVSLGEIENIESSN